MFPKANLQFFRLVTPTKNFTLIVLCYNFINLNFSQKREKTFLRENEALFAVSAKLAKKRQNWKWGQFFFLTLSIFYPSATHNISHNDKIKIKIILFLEERGKRVNANGKLSLLKEQIRISNFILCLKQFVLTMKFLILRFLKSEAHVQWRNFWDMN